MRRQQKRYEQDEIWVFWAFVIVVLLALLAIPY